MAINSNRIKVGRIILGSMLISTILLLTSFSIPAFSESLKAEGDIKDPAALFYRANLYFEKGQFEAAINTYQRLSASGYESGNLYFNMGNSYLKLGEKGPAILYYEKAKRLMPWDVDLKSNLALALTGVNEGEINWTDELFRSLFFLAPLDKLAVGSSISFFLLILFIGFTVFFPSGMKDTNTGKLNPWWLGVFIFSSCLFIFSVSITVLTYLDRQQTQAVTIKSGANARFEPGSNATICFPLSEGTRVYLGAIRGNWCLIKRPDRKRGWVERRYLEKI